MFFGSSDLTKKYFIKSKLIIFFDYFIQIPVLLTLKICFPYFLLFWISYPFRAFELIENIQIDTYIFFNIVIFSLVPICSYLRGFEKEKRNYFKVIVIAIFLYILFVSLFILGRDFFFLRLFVTIIWCTFIYSTFYNKGIFGFSLLDGIQKEFSYKGDLRYISRVKSGLLNGYCAQYNYFDSIETSAIFSNGLIIERSVYDADFLTSKTKFEDGKHLTTQYFNLKSFYSENSKITSIPKTYLEKLNKQEVSLTLEYDGLVDVFGGFRFETYLKRNYRITRENYATDYCDIVYKFYDLNGKLLKVGKSKLKLI